MTIQIRFIHFISQVSREYNHLGMRIAMDEPGYQLDNPHVDRCLELEWQSNAGSPKDWYGLHIKADAKDSEGFLHITSIVRKIQGRSFELRSNTSPTDVLDRLTQIKAIECAYDGRVSEWVPLADVLPVEYSAWRDDWNAYEGSTSGCMVGCMAKSEKEAKHLLLAEFSKLAIDSYNPDIYTAVLGRWIEAGMPAKKLGAHNFSRSPDVTPLANRLAA